MLKKYKHWKRFIALLVVLVLVIQCNFNAIALDSEGDKQQSAVAVVEKTENEETTIEEEKEEPKQEALEEKEEEPKQEAVEEKEEEPKQEVAGAEQVGIASLESLEEETSGDMAESDSSSVENDTASSQITTKSSKATVAETKGDPEERDIISAISSVTMKIQINENWYDLTTIKQNNSMKVPKGAPVEFYLSYGRLENVMENQVLVYQIPDAISILEKKTGNVMDPDGEVAGTYVINTDGKIELFIDAQYLSDHDNILLGGTVTVEGNFSSEWGGLGGDKEITFGNVTLTIPFEKEAVSEKKEISVKKEITNYDSSAKLITYKITVQTDSGNTQVVTNINIKDTFTINDSFVNNKYASLSASKGTFNRETSTWHIDSMDKGETATLTYTAHIINAFFNDIDVVEQGIKNEVVLTADEVNEKKSNITQTFNNTLQITKAIVDNSVNVDQDGKTTVQYKVSVTAPETNTSTMKQVSVKDVFDTTGQTFLKGYSLINTNNKGTCTPSDSGKDLIWIIGNMNPGETAELTYMVELDEKVWVYGSAGSVNRQITNNAEVFAGNKLYSNAIAEFILNKKWIAKNGTYGSGIVDFVIEANGEPTIKVIKQDQTKQTILEPMLNVVNSFSDTLKGDAAFVGVATVKVYSDSSKDDKIGETTFNIDGLSSWTWNPEGDLNGPYYYVIEYSARPNSNSGVTYFGNGASVGVGIGGGTFNPGASWKGTVTGEAYIRKAYKGGVATGVANWETIIPINISAHSKYFDTSENPNTSTHYFTQTQLDNIKITFGERTLLKETDYSVTGKNPDLEGKKYKSFEIEFHNGITGVSSEQGQQVIINYSSTVNINSVNNGETETFNNLGQLTIAGSVPCVEARANCSYTKRSSFKKSGSYNPKTQEITWLLDVNENSSMEGTATIVDSLPKGLTFKSASIVQRGDSASGTELAKVTKENITTRVDKDGKFDGYDVSLTLNGLVKNEEGNTNGWIQIKILTERETEELINTKVTYTNKATLLYGENKIDASADVSAEYRAITKESLYDSSTWPYVKYILSLNEEGKNLLKDEDSKTINVVDQMNEFMTLIPDSISVKSNEDDVSYTLVNDRENHKFTLTVPDDIPLTVTYNVSVNQPTDAQIMLVNKAYYEGSSSGEPTKDEKKIIVHDASATVSGPATLQIKKLDEDNITPLLGAEFNLYEVAIKDGNVVQVGEVRTGSTGDNGIVKFNKLELDRIYCYYESKAPAGYKLDDTKHFIAYSKLDGSVEALLNSQGDFAYGQKGIVVSIENKKTRVSIKKVDLDGNPVTGAALAIKDAETGEIVKRWTTDGNVKEITGELIAGRTYYLIEEKAPEGYLITADVEFTVPLKVDEDPLEVTMTDPKDEGTKKLGHISVTKKIVSREIAGDFDLFANDATYYVGLFTDPDGNHPYGQNAIREAHIVNGSASEPVVYEKLPTGTYYVLETTKNGTPIPMNSEVTDDKSSFVCEVTDGGTNAVEINTEAEKMKGKVNLTNAYLELPDGFAYRAFIDVTKKVLENGVEKATDETFYAGIFTGETENAPMTLVELKNNGKVTVEVPLGGPDGDQPITYYVFETDAQGNKLDKDTFIYIVSGEGQVSVSREKIQSDITITNNLISEVSLEILKVDEDGYGLEGAKFQITSEDGQTTLKSWKSGEESKEITLAPGIYKLTETVAPKGYIKGSDVTITISRDGTISIDGDDASLDDSVIEYVNQIDDSTTSKQDKKNGGTSKTGDPTHIMFYAILMAAALLGCMGVTRRKKGRHDR